MTQDLRQIIRDILVEELAVHGVRRAGSGNPGVREERVSIRSDQDLARFLGLAPETVSRLFRRFRDQGLVSARSRQIRIHDLEGLRALAQGAGER